MAQCAASGLWLTTEREQQIIAQRVDEASHEIPADDLDVLGFWGWRDGLIRGFAAHHAGMLPTFKEVVEKLFADGLVKAVFATETLALGVNMPARCVVLEKLEKFNGEAHVNITAGSTHSSLGGLDAGVSTSRAMPSYCGSREQIPLPWPAWRHGAPTR